MAATDLVVKTPAQKYAYGARLDIPDSLKQELAGHRVFIDVMARVTNGPVAIGVLTLDQKDFISRQPVQKDDRDEHVFLAVDDLSQAGPIVFQTWAG